MYRPYSAEVLFLSVRMTIPSSRPLPLRLARFRQCECVGGCAVVAVAGTTDGSSLTVPRSTFEEALTSPDTSALGDWRQGRQRCNHRLETRARGGTAIGPGSDLIHADPRIVTMFWMERDIACWTDGVALDCCMARSLVCGSVSTPVRKWQGLASPVLWEGR